MTAPGQSRPLDAVVAGYLGVDLTPGFHSRSASDAVPDRLRPGNLIEVRGLVMALGGVVANTGLAMNRFGLNVSLRGCVGRDALGEFAERQLCQHGAGGGVRRKDTASTGFGIVIGMPKCDRIFFEDPGCNGSFSCADLDFPTVARSRLFHLGYPTLMERLWRDNGKECVRIFRRVRQAGVATSLDLALPDPNSAAGKVDWAPMLAATLPCVDIFCPSIEEILYMSEPKIYQRILRKAGTGEMVDAISPDVFKRLADGIMALGVKILLIKAGSRGAYLRTGNVAELNVTTRLRLPVKTWNNCERWFPALSVDRRRMKNACGAGDCAVGGFLAAILRGADADSAGGYAMVAGRDNLYGLDAYSGLRSWRAMTADVARWRRDCGRSPGRRPAGGKQLDAAW